MSKESMEVAGETLDFEVSLPNPTELEYDEQLALKQMVHERNVALRDRIVTYLNRLMKIAPGPVAGLFEHRVPANRELVNHPTVVCNEGSIGLLGLLNGLLTENTRIASLHSGDGKLISFTAYTPTPEVPPDA